MSTNHALRSLVVASGLKQIYIAGALGIDHSTLSLYINGHKPLPDKHVPRLAEVLGVSQKVIRAAREG